MMKYAYRDEVVKVDDPAKRGIVLDSGECDCPDNPGEWRLVTIHWENGQIRTHHSFALLPAGKV